MAVPSSLKKRRSKKSICIICEGYEEKRYIERLININAWNSIDYYFIPINAKGECNISARFQDVYSSDKYDYVVIICDTDKDIKIYENIADKIDSFLGEKDLYKNVTIFSNPCIMQIILLHFDDSVRLISQSKKKNSSRIKELTGVDNYDAHEKQLDIICKKINRTNYNTMKNALESLSDDYKQSSSTNFGIWIKRFENKNDDWINNLSISLMK